MEDFEYVVIARFDPEHDEGCGIVYEDGGQAMVLECPGNPDSKVWARLHSYDPGAGNHVPNHIELEALASEPFEILVRPIHSDG